MKSSASSRLGALLAERKNTPAAFGKLIRANRSQVYRLLSGERGPSVGLAARIEAATGGAIKAADWSTPPAPARRTRGRKGPTHRRVARQDSHAPGGR
jgi:hypothetical protein